MPPGPFQRFRLAYDLSELFRRYFINTLFDATFVVLGIVSATAVVSNASAQVTLGTLAAATLAIGISTGMSVYEAERVEAEIRIAKIERAMLRDMADTDVHRTLRLYRTLVALVNFAAPLLVFAVTSVPFILHITTGWPALPIAAETSIVIAVALVFVSGFALGRVLEGSAIRQAFRMTIAALATFIVLILLQTYLL